MACYLHSGLKLEMMSRYVMNAFLLRPCLCLCPGLFVSVSVSVSVLSLCRYAAQARKIVSVAVVHENPYMQMIRQVDELN